MLLSASTRPPKKPQEITAGGRGGGDGGRDSHKVNTCRELNKERLLPDSSLTGRLRSLAWKKEQLVSLPTMQRCAMQRGGSGRDNKAHGCLSSREQETPLSTQQTQQHCRPKTHQREREKTQNTEGSNKQNIKQALASAFGTGPRRRADELCTCRGRGGQTCY